MQPAHEHVRERHEEHKHEQKQRAVENSKLKEQYANANANANVSESENMNVSVQHHDMLSYKNFQEFEEQSLATASHLGSVICALVAIKAGCSVVELEGAAVIGLLAAPLHRFFWWLQVNYVKQSR